MKKFLIAILLIIVIQIHATAAIVTSNQKLPEQQLQNSNIDFNIIGFKTALNNNDISVLNTFLESGINPNLTNSGTTILSYAISSGNIYAVEKILKLGADPNQKSKGITPLILAIKRKQPQIVKLLIETGADVNKTNSCAFFLGPKYANSPNLINNFDPTSKIGVPHYGPSAPIFPSPIFFAIETRQPEIAIMLINAGANVNCVNHAGSTPLDFAIFYDQTDIAKKLIEAGAIASSTTYVEYAKSSKDEEMRNLEIPLFYKKPMSKNVILNKL